MRQAQQLTGKPQPLAARRRLLSQELEAKV